MWKFWKRGFRDTYMDPYYLQDTALNSEDGKVKPFNSPNEMIFIYHI